MLFNTLSFLLFFPVVTLVFFLLPIKYRWIFLLGASCYFYMSFIPVYILILLTTILIDYFAGIFIERSIGAKKKTYLVISIISTCLVLFIFKYSNFFDDNVHAFFRFFHLNVPDRKFNILLPIGLSFHTFQSLSYVIEVYRGHQKAEKHFGIYALYVMFYPQLVTGPIERPQNLLCQLRETQVFQYNNLINGLRLILFGLFLKMVIADNLAPHVDEIYKPNAIHESLSILIGIVFYSFQIYCDFWGYSSIAVGCALTMGFRLMDNFKSPYLARSINEFWQRWHISLSTWFRDYVYFSLGGNRVSKSKWIVNISIVFIVSGLWHGANWTFILWGSLFAFFYLLESLIKKIVNLPKTFSAFSILHLFPILYTFIIVSFLWVLFRSTNLHQAKEIFTSLIQNWHVKDSLRVENYVWLLLLLFLMLDVVLYNKRFDHFCCNIPFVFRWIIYSIMIFSIIAFSGVENYPFIYFQF
jgi:alginate O-acetyltransferase complex protein AlgI